MNRAIDETSKEVEKSQNENQQGLREHVSGSLTAPEEADSKGF